MEDNNIEELNEDIQEDLDSTEEIEDASQEEDKPQYRKKESARERINQLTYNWREQQRLNQSLLEQNSELQSKLKQFESQYNQDKTEAQLGYLQSQLASAYEEGDYQKAMDINNQVIELKTKSIKSSVIDEGEEKVKSQQLSETERIFAQMHPQYLTDPAFKHVANQITVELSKNPQFLGMTLEQQLKTISQKTLSRMNGSPKIKESPVSSPSGSKGKEAPKSIPTDVMEQIKILNPHLRGNEEALKRVAKRVLSRGDK